MKLKNTVRRTSTSLRLNRQIGDPFAFLPVVVDALEAADVSCRFCSVKMINRIGIVASLCPTCFEERCATCGSEVILANGELAEGLAVGPRGSWKCASCAGTLPENRAVKKGRRKKAP